MDWTIISAISEFVGAIGVIISIAYLSMQVRENNKSIKQEARDAIFREMHEWTCTIASSPSLSTAFVKGNADFHSLDEQQKGQYVLIMYSMTKIFESIFIHYCEGLIEGEVWERNYAILVSYISQKGGRFYVEHRLDAFDPRFQVLLKDPKSRFILAPASVMVESVGK